MKLFITALLLMAGTFSPVSAANWVPLPASESAEVDTDSYVDSGVRASMDLKPLTAHLSFPPWNLTRTAAPTTLRR